MARVQEGLIGLADTRIMSGTERTTARKVAVHQRPGHTVMIMTAGNRSLRDKALTYFEESLEDGAAQSQRLYEVVNALGAQLRRVAGEDRASLEESGLSFNLSALVGGQLERDEEPKLYLLYSQGNWVEVARATPYFVIGESGYGKSLLDRGLAYESSLADALRVGYLAFDATRRSTNTVGYPLDVVVYRRDTFHVVERRYGSDDLRDVSGWWHDRIRASIAESPDGWVRDLLASGPDIRPLAEPG